VRCAGHAEGSHARESAGRAGVVLHADAQGNEDRGGGRRDELRLVCGGDKALQVRGRDRAVAGFGRGGENCRREDGGKGGEDREEHCV
jgi:hypothetical protein